MVKVSPNEKVNKQGDLGSQLFFFFRLKVKCGGGKQNTSRNSQYCTVVLRGRPPEQPVQLASW